jgi:prevent-host-death family protein
MTINQVLKEAPDMSTKFSEDIVPLSDLKVNPGKVVRQAAETHRPVLLTNHGRGVAVVQSLSDYEKAEEERSFMRAVTEGLMDVEKGRVFSVDDVKKRLGMK